MTRTLGRRRPGPPRIAIADDAGLVYSDDYRFGWVWGFREIGCDVHVTDISRLRKSVTTLAGQRSIVSMREPMIYWKEFAKQIIQREPDLVFCHHGRGASHPQFLDALNRAGVPTAVYLCDEPYEVGETANYSPRFDFVFTMDPCTVLAHARSRSSRGNVFYLPPGVHTGHFKPPERPYDERKITALFLGNGKLTPRPEWLAPVERLVEGAQIRYMRTTHKGQKQWIPYPAHPGWYGNALLGLNVHRAPWISEDCYRERVVKRPKNWRIAKGLSLPKERPKAFGTGFWNDANLPAAHVNPRFLEMSACGALVISDAHRSELARLFPMAPQAEDPDHYVELVLYYLDHLDEAEEIARACSYLISRRHSYKHRAAEVLTRLGLRDLLPDEMFGSLGAPEAWLTPQELTSLGVSSSSEPTGRSERWSPRSGLLSTRTCGSPSEATSIDPVESWLL